MICIEQPIQYKGERGTILIIIFVGRSRPMHFIIDFRIEEMRDCPILLQHVSEFEIVKAGFAIRRLEMHWGDRCVFG